MQEQRERILVVDDDTATQLLLKRFLVKNGYSVECVGTAREMLDWATEASPNLILLDALLPDQNGFEALTDLRRMERTDRVPVIMLTGLTDPADRVRAIRSGADDYLGKPVHLDELLARVGLRIEQARQIREQRQAAVNAHLLAVGRVVASERIEDVVSRGAGLTRDLLRSTACIVMLWDADRRRFTAAGQAGLDDERESALPPLVLDAGAYPEVDRMVSELRTFSCSADTPADMNDLLLPRLRARLVLAVPLRHAQAICGMLLIGRGESEAFNEDEVALALSIGEQIGLALGNLDFIQQREQEALVDSLTGLQNRRGMQEALLRQLALFHATGQPLALLMLDLDGFKGVNDRYGHPSGDRVLRAVADTLRSCVRTGDVVARFGGDEFGVLVAGAPDDVPVRVAQRIVEQVGTLRLPEIDAQLAFTTSAGVALADDGDNARSLLLTADRALYAAKDAGRNCVRLAAATAEAATPAADTAPG